MRFFNEIILVAVLAIQLELGWSARKNVDPLKSTNESDPTEILNKLSKIGRIRRPADSSSDQVDVKKPRNTIDEVEFRFDPEMNRKAEDIEAGQKRRVAQANLIANKDKIKSSRGFQQISSIYKSFRRGDKIYGNSNINTVRFIPGVKGLCDWINEF